MSVKVLIKYLNENIYIREIIKPVIKLNLKELFTTCKNDFFIGQKLIEFSCKAKHCFHKKCLINY